MINNPGNIRNSAVKFIGETPSTGAFKNFQNLAYGYRAIMVILRTSYKRGNTTLTEIMNRYAPPSENPTDAYINYLATKTGIDPAADLAPVINSPKIIDLVANIARFEKGKTWKNDADSLQQAYTLYSQKKNDKQPAVDNFIPLAAFFALIFAYKAIEK